MPYPKRSPESRTIAYERSRAAKWRRVRFRDNRVEETKNTSMGGQECWCGEQSGHAWPGKDEGQPHPMPDVPDLPPRVQEKLKQQALQEAGVCPTCRGYPPLERPHRFAHGRIVTVPWCPTCFGMGTFPPPNSREHSRWLKETFGGEV